MARYSVTFSTSVVKGYGSKGVGHKAFNTNDYNEMKQYVEHLIEGYKSTFEGHLVMKMDWSEAELKASGHTLWVGRVESIEFGISVMDWKRRCEITGDDLYDED